MIEKFGKFFSLMVTCCLVAVTGVSCARPYSKSGRVDIVPEYVTAYDRRFPAIDDTVLYDNSLAAASAWESVQRGFRARVAAALRARGNAARDIELRMLLDHLDSSLQLEKCHRPLWNVSPLTGWLSEYQRNPRRTLPPRFVDNEIANLREGVRRGYTAPRANVIATLQQVDRAISREEPAEESARSALRRYRDYLAGEYLEAARISPGVSALPDGKACFDALIRRYTSTEITSDQLDSIGRALFQRATANTSSVPGDTAATGYRTSGEILAHVDSLLQRAWSEAPRWFCDLPRTPLPRAVAWEDADPNGPSAVYVPARASGPPEIMVNTRSMLGRNGLLYLDRVVFHEGIPGHHLQAIVAAESDTLRMGRAMSNTAYVEGWAVYASNLADEMGLYSREIARVPVRSSIADDATTFLVQAGIHVHGWTWQQAVDTVVRLSGVSRDEAEQQVSYFVAAPAHALAYPIGARTIDELRANAQQTLGSRFDLRAFHAVVLRHGPMPLSVLSQLVGDWVSETASSSLAPCRDRLPQ